MGVAETSHCFPLNGNPQNPGIIGIEGIRQTYRQMLPRIALSGPTYFSEVIRQFNTFAAGNVVTQTYQVLLILTDGEIHDMDRVK
jgi:copine 1/2/3